MKKETCLSLFQLGGFKVLNTWELVNNYWPRPDFATKSEYEKTQIFAYSKLILESPWWLVKTKFGLIEIGCRKRVIEINWHDTKIKCDVTKDDTTKGDFSVHAWTEIKAAEYLIELYKQLEAICSM